MSSSLRSLYLDLYERHRLAAASAKRKVQYLNEIKHLETFLGRPADATDLTDTNVTDVMQWLITRGCAVPTANKHRTHILALWRFLARKGIVDHWPDVQPFPEPERIPQAWTKAELAKLWQACAAQEGDYEGVPRAGWWLSLHAVLWDTGERISALVSTPWSQLDLDDGWLTVTAEQRKGRRRGKLFRLHADTRALLQQIADPHRELVWPWPFCSAYLWNRYTLLLKTAGLSHDRWSKFHRMRRSSASWYEAAGGDATVLLGHSSRRVTEKYLDPRVCGDRHAADLLFRVPLPETTQCFRESSSFSGSTRPSCD